MNITLKHLEVTMSNKKQSSIDWLIEKIEMQRENGNTDLRTTLHYCNKAKAMHKEEMKESYREGRTDQQSKEIFYHRNAELYFKETFGGNNETH